MCIAHRLLLSTSEISDATASMPSPGYFALQHRVAPPRKAYSLTRRLSSHSAHSTHFPFSNRFLEVPIKNRNYPLTKWRKCGRITMYIKAHKPLSRRSRVCRCAPESRAMVRARCVCIHEWTCEGKLKRAVRVRVRCGQHG